MRGALDRAGYDSDDRDAGGRALRRRGRMRMCARERMPLPYTLFGNAVARDQERSLGWWRGFCLESGQIASGSTRAGMLLVRCCVARRSWGEGARFLLDLLATGVAVYATMAIGTRRS